MNFYEIERIAQIQLENPENYSPFETISDLNVIFRIWRYWALRSQTSWLLYSKSERFFVRRVEWDRLKDCEYLTFPDGVPTLYGCENEVSAEKVKLVLEKLKSLSVQPFLTPSQFGIDGVTFGIETKSVWLRCRLSWWCEPPESWKPLSGWLNEAAEFFDSLLPTSTARMNDARYSVNDF